MSNHDPPPPDLPTALSPLDTTTLVLPSDPPPPYPSHRSSRRTRHHAQRPSQYDACSGEDEDEVMATETTPLLLDANPGAGPVGLRVRTVSGASTGTVQPPCSVTQTVLSLFRDDDLDEQEDQDDPELIQSPPTPSTPAWRTAVHRRLSNTHLPPSSGTGFKRLWSAYWRPILRNGSWTALFHLGVINFPWAVGVWVYLFVFTLTGTTLLITLPLGAVLCFFDLLGARCFARAELALQIKFHSPLRYPAPYPPAPIFTRTRPPTEEEMEAGLFGHGAVVRERSFYKNTYAMFTDPTTYRALFYFLIIKPSLTLLLTLLLLIFVPLSFALVFPIPAVLRAVRKLGRWQAEVAVEGLSGGAV